MNLATLVLIAAAIARPFADQAGGRPILVLNADNDHYRRNHY